MSTHHSVSIMEFRRNIYKYMGMLPLYITAKGKILFEVRSPEIQFVSGNELAKAIRPKTDRGYVFDPTSTIPEHLKRAIDKTEKKLEEFKKENFERPLVCPKHGGQLIGGKYACCE